MCVITNDSEKSAAFQALACAYGYEMVLTRSDHPTFCAITRQLMIPSRMNLVAHLAVLDLLTKIVIAEDHKVEAA